MRFRLRFVGTDGPVPDIDPIYEPDPVEPPPDVLAPPERRGGR